MEIEQIAPCVLLNAVQVTGGQRVGHHADKGVGERGIGGVGDTDFKEGGGNARVIGVERDKGIERTQLDLAGEAFIVEGQLGQGKFAAEFGILEVGQPSEIFAAWPPAKGVEDRTL